MTAKPIVALGGKTSQGTSKVVADELAHFNAFREASALVFAKHGAINTNEASRDLRTVGARFWPKEKETMEFLKLEFDEQVIPFIF